jgi:hypothetical protein
VRVLFDGLPPAVLIYSDQWMIQDASDLIIDARGNYLIASATPSNGLRAMNWVSSNGLRWGYYLVRHSAVQLAHDPLTGGIVIADATGGGELQLVAAGDPLRSTSALDPFTHPGISAAQSDGDLAAEADGDLFWIAGGSVWKHSRAGGTTALYADGYDQLRGAVIAASSGDLASESGWSLYVAAGANPTLIRELPDVDAPAGLMANDQGPVPNRGTQVNVAFGIQVYDLAADNDGRLLVGGTFFGSTHYLKRITLSPSPSIATVASSANGISGIVEGITVAPDDEIHVLTREGVIHSISENPLTVTTVFSDPAGQIAAGKDLALDVDGTLYVSDRSGYGWGKVLEVAGGSGTLLTWTGETRGLAADPAGGLLVAEWNDTGFAGTVGRFDFGAQTLAPLPGFDTINFANDFVWGDGDLAVDANGSIFAISEDDWSLVRYDPDEDGYERVGSGYLNHPSGLAIAPSSPGSGSTTGWSLFISEFDYLWEKIDMAPPASTLVDSSLGLVAGGGRTVHPRYGRPRSLAASRTGDELLISTAKGWVLALDLDTGALAPIAGPEQGLAGDLVGIEARGARILVASREGGLYAIVRGARGSSEVRIIAPAGLEPGDPGARLEPGGPGLGRRETRPGDSGLGLRFHVRVQRPGSGKSEHYVIDGWSVRRLR